MRLKLNHLFTFGLFYHNAAVLSSKMCSIIKVTDQTAIESAVKYLKNGFVIALPTDTLYGLACDISNNKAIQKLYDIKNRNFQKPLAVCVAEIKDIPKCAETSSVPLQLLNELLPGPVTIVLKRSRYLNKKLNPNVTNVAIRIPNHNFMKELLKTVNMPLALTSANESNEQSTLSVIEFKKIWNKLPLVIDGGTIPNPQRFGSTIIDLSVPHFYSIIRKGVAFDDIVEVLHKYNIVEINKFKL